MTTTTCTKCNALYEAGSKEQANEAVRLCRGCRSPRKEERRYREHPAIQVGVFSFVRVEHGHGLYESVTIKRDGEVQTTVSGTTGDAVAALLGAVQQKGLEG